MDCSLLTACLTDNIFDPRDLQYESHEDAANLVKGLLSVGGFKEPGELKLRPKNHPDVDFEEPEPWGCTDPTLGCRPEHAPFFTGSYVKVSSDDADENIHVNGWLARHHKEDKYLVKSCGKYVLVPRNQLSLQCYRTDGKSWREVKQEYWNVIQNDEYKKLCDVASGDLERLIGEHDPEGALRDAALSACLDMWGAHAGDIPDDVDEMPWVFASAELKADNFRESDELRSVTMKPIDEMILTEAALMRPLCDKIAIVHLFLLRLSEHQKRVGVEGRQTSDCFPRFSGKREFPDIAPSEMALLDEIFHPASQKPKSYKQALLGEDDANQDEDKLALTWTHLFSHDKDGALYVASFLVAHSIIAYEEFGDGTENALVLLSDDYVIDEETVDRWVGKAQSIFLQDSWDNLMQSFEVLGGSGSDTDYDGTDAQAVLHLILKTVYVELIRDRVLHAQRCEERQEHIANVLNNISSDEQGFFDLKVPITAADLETHDPVHSLRVAASVVANEVTSDSSDGPAEVSAASDIRLVGTIEQKSATFDRLCRWYNRAEELLLNHTTNELRKMESDGDEKLRVKWETCDQIMEASYAVCMTVLCMLLRHRIYDAQHTDVEDSDEDSSSSKEGNNTPSTTATAKDNRMINVNVIDIADSGRRVVKTETVCIDDCILGFDPAWLELPGELEKECSEVQDALAEADGNRDTLAAPEPKPKKCGMCTVM